MPTLQDFREELLKQDEPEAQEIALAIELFTSGSLNTFAKHTNVDTNNRLICYDILDLGAEPYGKDNARKLRIYHYAQSGFHGQAGAGEALKYLRPSDVVYYECGSRTRAYQGGQLPCTVRK